MIQYLAWRPIGQTQESPQLVRTPVLQRHEDTVFVEVDQCLALVAVAEDVWVDDGVVGHRLTDWVIVEWLASLGWIGSSWRRCGCRVLGPSGTFGFL